MLKGILPKQYDPFEFYFVWATAFNNKDVEDLQIINFKFELVLNFSKRG